MKVFYFLIMFMIYGCATLGLGEFEQKNENLVSSDQVEFVYQPLIGGKHNVFIAGDFNNWSETANEMIEKDGVYSIILDLDPGKYGYKFIVDGKWITDENADLLEDDGYGGENSIIFVGNKDEIEALRVVNFFHKPDKFIKEVYIVGSMNDWNLKASRMIETSEGIYSIRLLLKPGEYHYKFLEDGMNWVTDNKSINFVDDGFGGKNSVIIVDNKFDKVVLKEKDGLILDYGISTEQSLETINPLSENQIEFKAKTHINDVENVYLIKNSEIIKMEKIASDNSYDYFNTIINADVKKTKFRYCYLYEDGSEKLYLLQNEFSKLNDENKYFTYSSEIVEPFFTPDWVKNGIIYQIFPERFHNGNKQNDPDFKEWYYEGVNIPPSNGQLYKKYTEYYHLEDDWYNHAGLKKSPYHLPNDEGYQPDYNSFYGGDIKGIKDKLDYLEDLGVTIIYFNPLFEAKSNHKYDAVDYMKIDPHFGTNDDFKSLVKDAHSRGIKIIIDCAFNHTGETFWAFQESLKKGPKSKYYDWYEWKKWPLPDKYKISSLKDGSFKPIDYYECWWGFGHMPNLNFDFSHPNQAENNIKNIELADPNWEVVNYILDVSEFWIKEMDIDGFRLDVPNEVPFWFWKLFNEKVKSLKPDAYLVGELWSNAVDWVNSDYYDAVMNYAYFKDPVMRFFNSRSCNAKTFNKDLIQGLHTYPTQATQVMMNLIDSHDTFRFLESCNGDIKRLELAVLFQMTYVGTPHIWYGDEIGMMGGHDPDCRRPFNWLYEQNEKSKELRNHYKKLISIRKQYSSLTTGKFKTILTDGMTYGFEREDDQSKMIILINNDTKRNNISISVDDGKYIDLLTGSLYETKNGFLDIQADLMSGLILKKDI